MSSVGDEANQGTAPIRQEYQFDESALTRWMYEHIAGFEGPLKMEQFNGGQSNPTYKLITSRRCYVLRRKPPGALVAGAHDVEREARVLSALGGAGFPVATVHGVCTDETVIGTKFYIMSMVEGRIFWCATFPQVDHFDRASYFEAMNQCIAQLHSVNYRAIGLSDYGKPGNYLSRQIARWSKQYLQDTQAGRDAHMDALIEWLPVHVPTDEAPTIVHGDFRCDNLIFAAKAPELLAVLDWELSTIGDPLADFAYHAIMYRMPPDIVAGLAGADLVALGIPSEADYAAAYCSRTGRKSIPAYEFYIAFNFFRLAAIFHGIRGRVIRGTAASANAKERAKSFPTLAKLARESMEACR
jgi:aminoglycoside phosphotransferase (APT) family kinase protein